MEAGPAPISTIRLLFFFRGGRQKFGDIFFVIGSDMRVHKDKLAGCQLP